MCVEWKELRCALRGVSAYKQLTGAPELALMGQLLDALEAGRGEEALDRYTQLFYTLKEGNYAGLGAWLWDALRYRTSFGQNVLQHSIEVSELCGIMASELGVDVRAAKRAGLLHDLGKAIDHEVEGPHAVIGADLARRYGEKPAIVHAIEAHHGDVDPSSVLAVLVQAGDAISASRPGARRESAESYIKRLEKLEEIANSHAGVERTYAMQAGREVHVMVQPDKISDAQATVLAHDIAHQIEDEMEYPGQVRVVVIRESRAVDIAK